MDLSHSNTDARHANINNVGRDLNNVTNHYQTIDIYFCLFGPPQITQHVSNARDDLPRLIPGQALSEGGLVAYHVSDAAVVLDTAVDLIDQIMDLLMDSVDFSNGLRDLALEFESLQKTLTLTRLAIQKYDNKPLGQLLVETTTPEVVRCCIVLQELVNTINGTWLGLNVPSIGNLWCQIWQGRWDGDEFVALRIKLSESRQALQGLLMALHSVVWMELGNELRAGFVSLRRFHDLFSQRLISLDHIKINSVDVVSHLGVIIPVPTIFCSTWKDFDHVVQSYCKDCVGHQFIERGDYEVLRTEDHQIISPSELASTVQPGMKLEITIVLRPDTAFQDTKDKCPRCRHINLNVTPDRGWIHRKCSGQFQIAQALHQNQEMDAGDDGKECAGVLNEGHDTEGNMETCDKKIVSLASGSAADEASSAGKRRVRDDGDTQFFRRIRVICMNYSAVPLKHVGLGQDSIGIDDVLNHLVDGAHCIGDVDALVQSARESFQQIEDWYEGKSTSSNPAVIAVVKDARIVGQDYFNAMKTSAKVARHGITFAADAVGLCELLSQHPGADVRLFVDEMREIVQLARGDAKDTYGEFSAVRQTALQLINRISPQVTHRQDATPNLSRDSSLSSTQTHTSDYQKRHKNRKTEEDLMIGLDLLGKAAKNVGELANCVAKFASWCSTAETVISSWERQVMSAEGRRLSRVRISIARKRWGVLQKDYEVYKRSIDILSDFYCVDKTRSSAPWFKRAFTRKPTDFTGQKHDDRLRATFSDKNASVTSYNVPS